MQGTARRKAWPGPATTPNMVSESHGEDRE